MGAPGNAVAAPSSPLESTMVGSMRSGMLSASHARVDQLRSAVSYRPVTAALVWSVMCSEPPETTQAIQQSMVPNNRSRERSGS